MRSSSVSLLRICALAAAFLAGLLLAPLAASAQAGTGWIFPWSDPALSSDARANLVLKVMTEDEKLALVFGYFGSVSADPAYQPPGEARMGSAGYVPGIPLLGLPPQWITDAGMGVATQRDSTAPYRQRTALPSGLATAATWNTRLAYEGGAMIGKEARQSGFNVMLGGGVDLLREPRNGRNFEYAGEDPLLAGTVVGAAVAGIQSDHVIATVKHFAFNDQETGRKILNAEIVGDQARMSDLLAFELAIEQGAPGAVMCSYNRVDTVYACESHQLLDTILKRDWHYPGYVMSDWGAVHSTVKAALAGLDQESAYSFDSAPYFGAALKQALDDGQVPRARLDDMARRILRSIFAEGLVDDPVAVEPVDATADAKVAQADEEEAVVLLKNDHGLLPLGRTVKRIAVIGSHADKGVISGGGSSTVFPVGGNAVPGLGPKGWPGPIVYLPSPPLAAIKARLPGADVRYDDGSDPAAAARLAAQSDLVIVFANQWATEDEDVSLTLADGQDALIAAVSAANPNTVVVLETGGPVLMPWLDKAGAVLEAWFPGSGGGEAIARVLFGEVDASGRLPATFPAGLDQLPHPKLAGADAPKDRPFDVDYSEGAAVGYKWFDKNRLTPLFPFGYGLSYTQFAYSNLKAATRNGALTVSFDVTNTGTRAGIAVPQVYIGPFSAAARRGWEAPRRLAGWSKVELAPGATAHLSLTVDPRLAAVFRAGAWRRAAGTYAVTLGNSSADAELQTQLHLQAWRRAPAFFAAQAH